MQNIKYVKPKDLDQLQYSNYWQKTDYFQKQFQIQTITTSLILFLLVTTFLITFDLKQDIDRNAYITLDGRSQWSWRQNEPPPTFTTQQVLAGVDNGQYGNSTRPLSSTEASINHYYPIWTMVKPACIPEMTWIQPHLSISAIPHLPVFHKITDAALFSSSFNKKLWMDMKCNAENRAIMFRCQCLRWQMVKLNVRQLPTEEFTFSHCITEAYSHMSGFGNLKICYRCDHVTTVSTTDWQTLTSNFEIFLHLNFKI